MLAIYAPLVADTIVSFELVPPTVAEFAGRIERALAWLSAERDGELIGYAYATTLRSRAAYRWSVETSAYVHPRAHERGVATMLYRELIRTLAERGYCNAFAAIALPNDASVALHRKVGFEPIGVFASAGRKFGRWIDVGWWQLRLRDEPREAP